MNILDSSIILVKYVKRYIDNQAINQLKNREELIVMLLENLSETVGSKSSMPNKNEYNELKDKIDRKKEIIDKSSATLEEAKSQYEDLQKKIGRLDNLEEMLLKEIKNNEEAIFESQNDISEKFERIEYQKEHFIKSEENMQTLIDYLKKNKDSFAKLVNQ